MTSSKNKKFRKTPYTTSTVNLTEPTNAENLNKKDMIGTLEKIASLQRGKNAQLAARKISKKYKKMRASSTAKKINQSRKEKAIQKLSDKYEKTLKNENINVGENIKNAAAKKRARITAQNVLSKYKIMKARTNPRTFHVAEAELKTIQYSDPPQEVIFAGESILKAANEVFDFDKFKKERAESLDKMKKRQVDDELFANESVLAAVNKVFDFDKNAIREFKQQQQTVRKNKKLAADKVLKKYRNISKRKRPVSPPPTVIESFKKPSKKSKNLTNSALITARNILKKYKNIRF